MHEAGADKPASNPGRDRFHWGPAARLLLVAGERLGVPKDEIIAHSGVDKAELRPWRFRMPWAPMRALTESALTLTGEPALGLLAGLEGTLNYHGLVGSYYMHCSPWREWQRAVFEGVLPRVSNVMEMRCYDGEEEAWTVASPLPPEDPLVEPHLHLVLTQQILAMRLVFGSNIKINRVCLCAKSLGDPGRIGQIMNCPVEFAQPENCIVVPSDMPGRELPLADPWLRDQLRPQFEMFLQQLERGMDTALAVEFTLQQSLVSGAPTDLETMADRLKLKARSLTARLSEEGTSFKNLLDAARREHTLRQLSLPGVKLAAVAARLGFSDAAAFTRAFRRWTGTTPSEWLRSRGPLGAPDERLKAQRQRDASEST